MAICSREHHRRRQHRINIKPNRRRRGASTGWLDIGRREAERRHARMLAELDAASSRPEEIPTLSTFVAVDFLPSVRANTKTSTYHDYVWCLRRVDPHIGDRQIDTITVADCQRLADQLTRAGSAPLTVKKTIKTLGYVLALAQDYGYVDRIVTSRVRTPPVRREPLAPWTVEQARRFLVAAVIDRVTFNAHIIETGTESYRLRVTRQRRSTTGAKTREHDGANPG